LFVPVEILLILAPVTTDSDITDFQYWWLS